MKSDSRRLAFDILSRFEKGSTTRLKADVLIGQALAAASDLGPADRAFLTALVMGTLRDWHRLSRQMAHWSGRPLKAVEPAVRTLLRLGLFQLTGLSQVPAYAAIDTTVSLVKAVMPKSRRQPTARFVNAVLRAAQRNGPPFPVADWAIDPAGHLQDAYALPAWWSRRLLERYDPGAVLALAQAYQQPPELTIRVNALKDTPPAYTARLDAQGIPWRMPDAAMPDMLLLPGFAGSPTELPGYADGAFYVQNLSSAEVAHWVAPRSGERVLDLCAAPGSKTSHLAALMRNEGTLVAVDPKLERVGRLEENLHRLGVTNTRVIVADGRELAEAPFDRVLVDAPCSGTGTIRRHPEILVQLNPSDLQAYAALQTDLLARGWALTAPGGTLIYSTCSIEPEENRERVRHFLAMHPEAHLEAENQRLPDALADGFYIARLLKPSLP